MSKPKDIPIIVSGTHRSGTTWVGNMLCASGELFYIKEPFNINKQGPGWIPVPLPYWFYSINDKNSDEYIKYLDGIMNMRYPLRDAIINSNILHYPHRFKTYIESLVACSLGKRPLVKDPIAFFSLDWLAKKYNLYTIVMIRHPAAFVSSIKRLNWQFDFNNWLKQDWLINDLLSPYRDKIDEFAKNENDIIDQAILLWNVMHHVISRYKRLHPDWLFVKHEELSRNPKEGYRKIYNHCNLNWSKDVELIINKYSNSENKKEVAPKEFDNLKRNSKDLINLWKDRLSNDEIKRVYDGTSDIRLLFYKD